MALYVHETLWHFAGYFHLAELLGYTPVHYSGAPLWKTSGFNAAPAHGLIDPRYSFATSAEPAAVPDPGDGPLTHLWMQGVRSQHFNLGQLHFAPLHAIKAPHIVLPSEPDLSFASTTIIGSIPTIHLAYDEMGTKVLDLDILQHNTLVDLNDLLGDPRFADLLREHPDVTPLLQHMVGQALFALPNLPDLPVQLEGVSHSQVFMGGGNDLLNGSNAGIAEPEHIAANTHFIDGEAAPALSLDTVAPTLTSAISTALDTFWTSHDDIQRDPTTETVTDPTHAIITSDGTPTDGYAQIATAGENHSLNIAVMNNTEQGAASMVIRGDLHVTNAIYQVNVLYTAGYVDADGAAIAQQIVLADNQTTNDASFVKDQGLIFGDGVSGWSGATNWHVDYVNGDFWNISELSQTNVLLNGNLAQISADNTHFTATMGADHQLNLSLIDDASTHYDLIIVGGDFYKLNAIVQVNVVLDMSTVSTLLGGDGEQSLTVGGDTLSNQAIIVNVGGDSWKPMTVDATTLADAIAGKSSAIDALHALGIPGNGTDTLNVLYVSGNYYEDNVIAQTNLVGNVNDIQMLAPDGAQGIPGADTSGGLAQTATAGGNQAVNIAAIIDQGSASGYQYLGGTEYDDNLLVQANIVTDDSHLPDGTLHPDTVAAIAAMDHSGTVDTSHLGLDHLPSAQTSSPDVMGGAMHA